MIPSKIFLESIKTTPADVLTRYKINLILNGVFYNQIKQFHTRYLCVTSHDILSLELFLEEQGKIIASTTLSDLYKLILHQKTIDLKYTLPNFQVILKLCFQPVTAYKNLKAGEIDKNSIALTSRQPETNKRSRNSQLQTRSQRMEMLRRSRDDFSDKTMTDRAILIEEESKATINEDDFINKMQKQTRNSQHKNIFPKESLSFSRYSGRSQLMQTQLLQSQLLQPQIQNESLDNLAHQREKILQELFGRFRKNK